MPSGSHQARRCVQRLVSHTGLSPPPPQEKISAGHVAGLIERQPASAKRHSAGIHSDRERLQLLGALNRGSGKVRKFVARIETTMSALGHVWTAPPWQELSGAAAALVGCGHVSGLFVRPMWPLVMMLCAGPSRKHAFKDDPSGFSRSPDRPCLHYIVMSSLQTPSSLPGLTSLNRAGFDATNL